MILISHYHHQNTLDTISNLRCDHAESEFSRLKQRWWSTKWRRQKIFCRFDWKFVVYELKTFHVLQWDIENCLQHITNVVQRFQARTVEVTKKQTCWDSPIDVQLTNVGIQLSTDMDSRFTVLLDPVTRKSWFQHESVKFVCSFHVMLKKCSRSCVDSEDVVPSWNYDLWNYVHMTLPSWLKWQNYRYEMSLTFWQRILRPKMNRFERRPLLRYKHRLSTLRYFYSLQIYTKLTQNTSELLTHTMIMLSW